MNIPKTKYKAETYSKEEAASAVISSKLISEFRKKHEKSQSQFAEDLGVKQSRISHLESGRVAINSVWLLKKVSDHIGVKPSDLRPDLF